MYTIVLSYLVNKLFHCTTGLALAKFWNFQGCFFLIKFCTDGNIVYILYSYSNTWRKNGDTNYILKLSGIQLFKDMTEQMFDYINEIVLISMKSFEMLNRVSVNCII